MVQAATGNLFSITPPIYIVEGVRLPDGKLGVLHVTEKPLSPLHHRGKYTYCNPSEFAEIRKQTGFGPASLPLYMACVEALHDNDGKDGAADLKQILSWSSMKHTGGLVTSTSVIYRAAGPDVVRHDVGTPEERTLEVRLVGRSGYLNRGMEDVTQALFGKQDFERVNALFKWLTGYAPFLSVLCDRPEKDTEMFLSIAISSGLGTAFGGVIDTVIEAYHRGSYGVAHGMRIAPQNSAGIRN